MESNQLNTEGKDVLKVGESQGADYNPKLDWKFQSVVFMANNFTSTLGIEPFTAVDLELSFKNPRLDPLCLNILNKLLLKKANFKPSIKITDWEGKQKLQDVLVKKLVHFYKIYARTISTKLKMPFSKEAIELDLSNVNYSSNERYNITNAEAYYNEIEIEPDLKKLMILELFRSLKGKNPIFSEDMYSYNRIHAVPITGISLAERKEPTVVENNKKRKDSDDDSVKSDISVKKKNNDNDDSDSDSSHNKDEVQFETLQNRASLHLIDPNIKEDQYPSLVSFENFELKEKVEILYFFYLYSMEYSGRSNFFKHEAYENEYFRSLVEDSKTIKISAASDYSRIYISKSCLPHLNNNNSSEINKFTMKQNKILGYDELGNCYSIPLSNKSCIVMKDNYSKSSVEVVCSNYSEVEALLERLEKNRQESSDLLLAETNKKDRKQKQVMSLASLRKSRLTELNNNIKDLLLSFKEYEEEEKKKDSAFLKKTAIASRNSAQGKEFVLMNMTEHITTRRQLNKLAQEAVPVISAGGEVTLSKYREPTYEDIKRQRVEMQTQERERRMMERRKQLENQHVSNNSRSNDRSRVNYNENSDDEFYDGNNYNSKYVTAENRKIVIKTSDSRSESQDNNRNNLKKRNSQSEVSEDKYSEYQATSSANDDYSGTSEYKNHRIAGRRIVKKGRNRDSREHKEHREKKQTNRESTNHRDMNAFEIPEECPDNEIIMDCSLVLRYSLNQLEIVGNWGITSDAMNEKMSYLFSKSNEKQRMFIKKSDINFETTSNSNINISNFSTHIKSENNDDIKEEENNTDNDNQSKQLPNILFPDSDYKNTLNYNNSNNNNNNDTKKNIFFTSKDLENYETLEICISNLHELIQINHPHILSEILKFLSAEYAGYFVYFSKTIEDKFTLSMKSQDSSLVFIEGEGVNCLGKFSIKGYMSLFRDRLDLLRNNNLDEDFIRLGKIKLTRTYVVFNPNENERVMKSFTHRKRRKDDSGEVIYGLSYTGGRREERDVKENYDDEENGDNNDEFDNYEDEIMN